MKNIFATDLILLWFFCFDWSSFIAFILIYFFVIMLYFFFALFGNEQRWNLKQARKQLQVKQVQQ